MVHVSDHESKAEILWQSFKERLGVSEFTGIQYDLSTLLHEVDLPVLDDPFSVEEIIVVLKDIPSDHAPGLDGFNGVLYKKNAGALSKMTSLDYVLILQLVD